MIGVLPAVAELRLGIVGLDSSHCVRWTALLNDPDNPDRIPGARVVAAYKGGSPDVEMSYTRIDGFTREMNERWGVEIVPTIEEVCEKVDAVMVLSVDGRVHLEQARRVLAARKPLFIDKPMASTLREAMEIFTLAQLNNVPVFSASGYRVRYRGAAALDPREIGEIKGAASQGRLPLEPTLPYPFFFYGIHSTEGLFTYLGTGCESVVRVATEDTDVIVGVWEGGRVGTVRGIRNASRPFRVTVYGTRGVIDEIPQSGHVPLVTAVVHFFRTGDAPVTPEETLEIIAFMQAADESKQRGGSKVYLKEIFEAARQGIRSGF